MYTKVLKCYVMNFKKKIFINKKKWNTLILLGTINGGTKIKISMIELY